MNIFKLLGDFRALVSAGNELKASATLVNVEALGALLYGIIAAALNIALDLGVNVSVPGVDLHAIANGWAATAGLVYGVYRASTHPGAGLPAPKKAVRKEILNA